MGSGPSKSWKKPCEKKEVERLREKVRMLEKEVREIMGMRESECRAYEQEIMAYANREEEWKRERKRMMEEVKRLRKRLEEREREDLKGIVEDGHDNQDEELGWKRRLVDQMREERARRDEAIHKWKQLYLAIKVELDDLIKRTHQGERLFWRREEEEEDIVEKLKREVKAKEEAIEILHRRITSMKQEEYKRKREMDIMKQSLKIMSHHKKKQTTGTRKLSTSFRL